MKTELFQSAPYRGGDQLDSLEYSGKKSKKTVFTEKVLELFMVSEKCTITILFYQKKLDLSQNNK